MPKVRRLVFLRHGETTGQSSIRYYGATDVPLSAVGREQMLRAAPVIAAYGVQKVYTSALCRTREAATLVAPGLPATPLAELNEVHFGDWEGLTRDEIERRHPEAYARWTARTADFCYPNGESLRAFRARVEAAVAKILDDEALSVLVIAHRGVIVRALAYLLDSQHEASALQVALGSVHVVERSTQGGPWTPLVLDWTGDAEQAVPAVESVPADRTMEG